MSPFDLVRCLHENSRMKQMQLSPFFIAASFIAIHGPLQSSVNGFTLPNQGQQLAICHFWGWRRSKARTTRGAVAGGEPSSESAMIDSPVVDAPTGADDGSSSDGELLFFADQLGGNTIEGHDGPFLGGDSDGATDIDFISSAYNVTKGDLPKELTRRLWISKVSGALATGGAVVVAGGSSIYYSEIRNDLKATTTTKKLAPVNVTKVVAETNINIAMECKRYCVSVDGQTFQKKSTLKLPGWIPSYFVPEPKVIRDYTTSELLTAAILAGSAVEMGRTVVLYPLQTLKTRIQTDSNYSGRRMQSRRRLKIMRLKAQRHLREGNLYAGLLPSILVSVPATGVYYGARDVTRRMVAMAHLDIPTIPLALLAAFIGDVASLMFRTPADTLALRLQAATATDSHLPHMPRDKENHAYNVTEVMLNDFGANSSSFHPAFTENRDENVAQALALAQVDAKVGNWLLESIERLPAAIVTDLPYLLTRIALNSILISGPIDVGRYELVTFTSACICAFLTTPFDVARTRILVENNTGGVISTLRTAMREGDGGIRNLFAGWLERTLYLGISSLWLPFALVFYIAIRDSILLEVFD